MLDTSTAAEDRSASSHSPALELSAHGPSIYGDGVRQPLRRKVVVFATDVLLVAAVAFGIGLTRGVPVASLLFMIACFPLAFYAAGLYERRLEGDTAMFVARLIVSALGVLLLVGPASYLFRGLVLPRGVVAMQLLFVLALFPWQRLLLDRAMRVATVPVRVAVLGAGKAGRALIDVLSRSEVYQVAVLFDDDVAKHGHRVGGHEIAGPSPALLGLNGSTPDLVAVAVTHDKSPELVRTLLECRRRGIRIVDMVTAYEEVMGRLPVEHLSDLWIAFWSNFSPVKASLQWKVKRSTDVVGALVLLVIFALPLVVAALLIRFTSRGPVFFRQRRVGMDGRTFRIVKLRTMREGAEPEGRPLWASVNDERTTFVGRYLRRMRLDEVPQLFNVLRGEMSLVGPRPERPEFVRMLDKAVPYYLLRHMVKPGLTGWAQISYPYGASVFDARMKLEYDLYYIRHLGPIFDLRIMLRTVHALLLGGGR